MSQNAVQHGLLARSPVLSADEKWEYDKHAELLRSHYAPEGPLEANYVELIIDYLWRLRRIPQIEAGLLLLREPKNRPPTEIEPESAGPTSLELGQAFCRADLQFSTLSRYESQIRRSLEKAMDQLGHQQYARKMQADPYYYSKVKSFPAPDMQRPANTNCRRAAPWQLLFHLTIKITRSGRYPEQLPSRGI